MRSCPDNGGDPSSPTQGRPRSEKRLAGELQPLGPFGELAPTAPSLHVQTRLLPGHCHGHASKRLRNLEFLTSYLKNFCLSILFFSCLQGGDENRPSCPAHRGSTCAGGGSMLYWMGKMLQEGCGDEVFGVWRRRDRRQSGGLSGPGREGRLTDRPGRPFGGHPEKRPGAGEPAWDLCHSSGGGRCGALLLPS